MEIILQSQDEFNEVGVLDPHSGKFSIVSKIENPKLSDLSTSGYFCHMDDKLICFFRLDSNLVVKVDDQLITLDNRDKVMLESRRGDQYHFKVQKGMDIVISLIYKRTPISPPISAYEFFNPMITEESFDIFLFIYNAFNDSGRRDRVFRSKRNPQQNK